MGLSFEYNIAKISVVLGDGASAIPSWWWCGIDWNRAGQGWGEVRRALSWWQKQLIRVHKLAGHWHRLSTPMTWLLYHFTPAQQRACYWFQEDTSCALHAHTGLLLLSGPHPDLPSPWNLIASLATVVGWCIWPANVPYLEIWNVTEVTK